MVSNKKERLRPYLSMIHSFLEEKISAGEFEKRYLEVSKNDETRWPEEVFLILDKLFSDVDAYCGDPDLRDEDDIDEEELRMCAREALLKLERYLENQSGKE